MPGVRRHGEEIRGFILANITGNSGIAALTARQFGISLPAVYKHIDRLVSDKQIIKKNGLYALQSTKYKYSYKNEKTLSEDAVWEKDIKKHFANIPQNAQSIWIYGFLEIFNNAIEHSKGNEIRVIINENKINTSISIADNGIGIFKKIKTKYRLIDEKDALLELAKGKRTTDNIRHSGQGIFFTSRTFDDFIIVSNGITFNSNIERKNNHIDKIKCSTLVFMRLANSSNKIIKDIFDTYSTEIPGDFDKTIIPIRLANSDDLVSRSQARRVLSGLELFKEVIIDFSGIKYIGQAFADEIFRVFPGMNPDTKIFARHANSETQEMINRAINTKL